MDIGSGSGACATGAGGASAGIAGATGAGSGSDSGSLVPPRLRLPNCMPTFSTPADLRSPKEPNEDIPERLALIEEGVGGITTPP